MPTAEDFNIVRKGIPTFYFIGVTTAQSSIMKVFPLWMEELERREVTIEGMDLKIHDQPEAYRAAVAQIRYDPLSLGALVTTHKIDLFEAARDLFDYVDPYAQTCGEVSSISKCDGRLEGHAKDPITAGLSMDALLGKNYFGRTGGGCLVLWRRRVGGGDTTSPHQQKEPGGSPQSVHRCQPLPAAPRPHEGDGGAAQDRYPGAIRLEPRPGQERFDHGRPRGRQRRHQRDGNG